MRCTTLALALAIALSLSACQTKPNLKRTYDRMLADYAQDDGTGGMNFKVDGRQRERCAHVVELYEEGKIETIENLMYGARILVTSDVRTELELAQELAIQAAERGEESAYPIQAEALDRLLLKAGYPQRYGTQYVWEPVLKKWRLYAVDPLTTDALRKAMGIPPLSVILARVDELNASQTTETLKREF